MKKYILLAITIAVGVSLASCMKDGFYYEPAAGLSESRQEGAESGDVFNKIQENDFVKVSEQPVSTFSVDADGAAYSYMRRCINSGFLPDANSVRIEEFLNYFTFRSGHYWFLFNGNWMRNCLFVNDFNISVYDTIDCSLAWNIDVLLRVFSKIS